MKIWSWDRVLAVIGIVVGIPEFLRLFLTERWQEGVFVLVVVMICIAWSVCELWREKQPVFTMILIEKKLTIRDSEGKKSTLSRTHTARVNHKGITVMVVLQPIR